MTHEELAAAFESGRLDPASFGHAEHVRLAWFYLGRFPLLEAAMRLCDGLKRYTKSIGAGDKYHETITLAWMFLVHERRARHIGADWACFRRANPDLFRHGASALEAYYRRDTLRSAFSRRVFVLPDRGLEHAGAGYGAT